MNNTNNMNSNIKDIPPFPADIPTAPLHRLSLSKLLTHDPPEVQRLMRASEQIGFFYLDLQDSEHGRGLLDDADALFGVGEELFALDLHEKERFDFSSQGSYFGYKGLGKGAVDKEGGLDRNEFFNVFPPSPYIQTCMECILTDVGIKRRPPKHTTKQHPPLPIHHPQKQPPPNILHAILALYRLPPPHPAEQNPRPAP